MRNLIILCLVITFNFTARAQKVVFEDIGGFRFIKTTALSNKTEVDGYYSYYSAKQFYGKYLYHKLRIYDTNFELVVERLSGIPEEVVY